MIIFKVNVADFVFRGIDAESQAPVASNAKAPNTFAVPRQQVRFPCRKPVQFLYVPHVIEKRQHLSQLAHSIGGYAPDTVFVVKLSHAFMRDAPNLHQDPA